MVAAWLQKLCDVKFRRQEGVLSIAHHGAINPAVEGRTHGLKLQENPDQSNEFFKHDKRRSMQCLAYGLCMVVITGQSTFCSVSNLQQLQKYVYSSLLDCPLEHMEV